MLNPEISARRERRVLSVGEIPTWQLSFQPVAIGTVVEVTKRLKLRRHPVRTAFASRWE